MRRGFGCKHDFVEICGLKHLDLTWSWLQPAISFEVCCRRSGGQSAAIRRRISAQTGPVPATDPEPLSIGCGYFTDDKRAAQAPGVPPLAEIPTGRCPAPVGKRS
jgi:hypothetical protein